MEGLKQDVRYALRGIARAPGFALAVVFTLALGVGANTTMFGVLDVLFLRPPALVRDPGGVARVYFRRTIPGVGTFTGSGTSVPVFEALEGTPGLEGVAAWFDKQLSLGRGGDARRVTTVGISASFFPLLGVTTTLGRGFTADDDRVGAVPVAVISHRFWRSQFHADPAALGQSLALGRGSYAVVGVAPEGFTGVDTEEPDVWLPLAAAAPDLFDVRALTSRGYNWIDIVARLAPGTDRAAAEANATQRHRQAAAASERPSDSTATVVLGGVLAARGPALDSDSRVALWVGGVAVLVLLVACANAANLMLARGVRRRRELAVRAGLGAGRGRLVRLFATESLVLALAGGGAGLLLAVWGGSVVRAFLLPGLSDRTSLMDPRVLGFTLLVAVAAGVLAGVAPAWHASRADVAGVLRAGGRDLTATRGGLRTALVASQVAMTVVLLAGAGLFVRSLRNVQTIDYGMDLDQVLVAEGSFSSAGIARDEGDRLYLQMLERIGRHPAVAGAAVSSGTPYGSSASTGVRFAGVDSLPISRFGGPYYNEVSPGYLAVLGTPIVRGRDLSDADVAGGEHVTVLSQALARAAWPDRDPIGQCIYVGQDATCTRVVGIAADAREQGPVTESPSFYYYLPLAQHIAGAHINGLVLRTRGPAAPVLDELRRSLQAAAPGLPYVPLGRLLDRVTPQWRSWRLGAAMFSAFGLLALAIAGVGLYGVTAYSVGQRTQEIGVRIALGAQRGDVQRMVVWQGVRAAGVGAAIGTVAALGVGRGVAALLYGVSPRDPAVLGSVVVVLLLIASLAAYVPARRAARIDPMEALRAE